MAKKENLKTSGKGFDDDLDLPDFDFDLPQPKDDRKPVSKILGNVRKGFTSSFKDPAIIERGIRKGLPDGYGEALNVAGDIKSTVKDLYDTAAKEIKPGLKEMTKAANKMLPESARRTKGLLDKINKWSSGDSYSSSSGDDAKSRQDFEIASSIDSIFKFQMENEVKRNEELDNRDKVSKGLDIMRHRDQMSMLNSMNIGISRLSQYQDKVTASWQKKSLELQYRSYFVQAEQLEESKRANALMKTELASITKNTGLPEFVKLKTSERFSEITRNKFMTTAMDSMFGPNSMIMGKIKSSLMATVKDYASQAADAFYMGASMAENAAMAKEMGADEGGAASMVGGMAGEWVQDKVFSKVKGYAEKNEKVRRGGKNAAFLARNFPQILAEKAKKHKLDGGVKGALAGFLNDVISKSTGTQGSLETDKLKDLNGPSIYTTQANKSITEIIPGYLSRILREIQITRTGNENTSLITYDYTRNTFSTDTKAKASILEAISSKSSRDSTKSSLDSILNEVDPKGKLSPEAREVLAKQILKDKFSGTKVGSDENYVDSNRFGKHSDAISKVFKEHFGDKTKETYQDKRASFNDKFNRLGSSVEDSRGVIQALINAGMYDTVRDLGLLNDIAIADPKRAKGDTSSRINQGLSSNINFDRLLDMQLEDHNLEEDVTTSNTSRNKKRRGYSPARSSRIVKTKQSSSNITSKLDNSTSEILEKINKNLLQLNTSYTEGNEKVYTELNKVSTAFLGENGTGLAQTNETLSRIEQILMAGINIGNNVNSGTSDDANAGSSRAFINIHTGKFGKAVIGGAKRVAGGIFSGIKTMHNAGMATMRGAFGIATGTANTVKDIIKSRWDIYYGKESEPRILAAKMRAGSYFNYPSGKPIRVIEDIKEEVRDTDGNTVVQLDEIEGLYAKGNLGKKIFKLGTSLLTTSFSIAGKIHNAGMFTMNVAKNAAKGVLGFVRDQIDGPGDVYIKGDTEPVLLGRIMKAGGYISKLTGKIISRMSEIDGTIVDKDGNVLLTVEDIKKGIVDKDGEPIRGLVEKIAFKATAAVASIFRTGKNILTSAAGGMKRVLGALGQGALNIFTGIGDALGLNTWGKKNTEVLERIYKLLDSRMPGKKKVLGDTDGDGLREGSWQENRKNRKAKKEDKAAPGAIKATGEEPKRKNIFDAMAEKAAAAKDGIKDMLGMGADAADIARGGGKAADTVGKTAGQVSKWGKYAGSLKGAGIGLGLAGAGAIANATGHDKIGSVLDTGADVAGLYTTGSFLASLVGYSGLVGSGSLGAAALGGAGAAGTAVAGAASTAATVGMAGLTALGSIISAPVVLGALAIGAIGYGGYKLYKHFHKLTDNTFMQYRLAQYGFTSADEDIAEKVLHFEELMAKQVKIVDGKAILGDQGTLYDEVFECFGFKPSDDKAVNNWAQWLNARFKPVYLTHITALNAINGSTSITGVDKLSPEDKLKYLANTVIDDSVYNFTISPFPEIPKLVVDASDIQKVFTKARLEVEEEIKKAPVKTEKAGAIGAATVSAGAASLAATKTDSNIANADKESTSILSTISKSFGKLSDAIGLTTAFNATSNYVSYLGDKVSRYLGMSVKALEAIRYRTYGLKAMDAAKVRALRDLEELADKGFFMDAAGVPTWRGNPEEISDKAAGFGIFKRDAKATQIFMNWFQKRFLPAYTVYRGELFLATGKNTQAAGEAALKPEDQLPIGEKINACSVWSVMFSPWNDYELNTTGEGVQENLQFLRNLNKEKQIAEDKVSAANKAAGFTSNANPANTNLNKEIEKRSTSTTLPQWDYVDPDAEPNKDKGSGGGGSNDKPNTSIGSIANAGGEMRDGGGAKQYLTLRNAKMDGVHPDMQRLFYGMVQEYGERTGKTVGVNAAYRTYAEQLKEYNSDPSKAAKPGSSMHEYGLAIDVDSATLDEMEKMGLMRKYGLTRPVGNEPWHVEPAGIQTDISKYKKDGADAASAASQAIAGGIGKGGGGWGTVTGKQGHGRNTEMAKALLEANIQPQVASNDSDTGTTIPTTKPTLASSGGMMKASYSPTASDTQASGSFSAAPSAPVVSTPSSNITAPNTGVSAGTDTPGSTGLYSKIANPQGSRGWSAMKDMVLSAAKAVGIDPKLLATVLGVESSFDPNAKNGTSSAGGLSQFISSTWNEMVSKYGAKFGIPSNASVYDPKANALLGAQYIKDNAKAVSSVKSDPSGADVYLAHLLGPAGAAKLLKASPETLAANLLPEAARSNREIFFDGNRARSVSEVYSFIQSKVNTKLTQLGVDPSYFSAGDTSYASNTKTNTDNGIMRAVYRPSEASNYGGSALVAPVAPAPSIAPVMSSGNTFSSMSGYGTPDKPPVVQNQNSDMKTAVSAVTSVLSESLSVQQQMLEVLKGIHNKIGAVASGNPNPGTTTNTTKTPQQAPSVPVPMRSMV